MIRNWALFDLYHVHQMNFRFWHKVVIQYRTPFIHYPKFRLPAEPFFRLRKTLHESNQTFCLSMLYCVLLGYSFEFRLNCNSRVRGAAASVMTISVYQTSLTVYQTRLKRENKIDKSRSSMGLRRLQTLYAIQADKTIRILLHRRKDIKRQCYLCKVQDT